MTDYKKAAYEAHISKLREAADTFFPDSVSWKLRSIADELSLPAAPHEIPKRDGINAAGGICEWYPEPELEFWNTGCGGCFLLNEGTPTDNGMKFCCYCGKPVKEVELNLCNPDEADDTALQQRLAEERERCAKACDDIDTCQGDELATAIRSMK